MSLGPIPPRCSFRRRAHPFLSLFRYNLVDIKVDRSYYIWATAPEGYAFTSGVCNDDVPHWECDRPNPTDKHALGIREGRSSRCVVVDRTGLPDSTLDLGDLREETADVALLLGFDRVRALLEDRASRSLLGERDKDAIGSVAAEVLAGTIDERLARSGVELDAVVPKEVVLSSDDADGDRLAVALEIRGHYSPPPEIDFDYIVQDSINSDVDAIRRGLRDYNANCRDQTSKVNDLGYSPDDFDEVHSMEGARPNRKNDGDDATAVYRTACADGNDLPEYFETSLRDVEARPASAWDFRPAESVLRLSEGARLRSWAAGPVAGLAGTIALLMGTFVFRRAVGPRRAAKRRSADEIRGLVDAGGERGAVGGRADDGSVDSAFYSDDDDFGPDEKKAKGKRIEKGETQPPDKFAKGKERMLRLVSRRVVARDDASTDRPGTYERRAKDVESVSNRSKRSRKSRDGSRGTKPYSGNDGKLPASHGSDDTESSGKLSSETDDSRDKKRREKRRPASDRRSERKYRASRHASEKRSSSASGNASTRGASDAGSGRSSKRSRSGSGKPSRRGRDSRTGGDHAGMAKEFL